MKNKKLKIGLLLGFVAFGALTYQMNSYTVYYPERMGDERYHQYSTFGIPFFTKKTNESFPYDEEYTAIRERSLESDIPLQRYSDFKRTLLSSVHRCGGYGWKIQTRREMTEAIYLKYRSNSDVVMARRELSQLDELLPADWDGSTELRIKEFDDLRDILDLERLFSRSEQVGI